MQCFRIMDMPDRVIAFDELPERLLDGFELCRADGFPRHWKEWLGKRKKLIKIPPEKDFLSGQIRRFDPIVEEDYYFFLVDWTMNPVVEKWKEVCDFVRQHVDKSIRLSDNIDTMAKPLAANKTDGVTLEPEDVLIIPIPLEYQEKNKELILPVKKAAEPANHLPAVPCGVEGCSYEAQGSHARQAVAMHKRKKHPKPEAVPAA